MAKLFISAIIPLVLLCLAPLADCSGAVHGRSQTASAIKNLLGPFPAYTVPVQGAFESLPSPQPGFELTLLSIARGNITYSCANRKPVQPPVYISQFTTLWDAASLLPHIADESQFHTIVPQLFDFDYAVIANSSLVCIGTIDTVQGQAIVDIFDWGMFRLSTERTIQGPEQSKEHLGWAYEISDDQKWKVYRVETVSDAVPISCNRQKEEFAVDYAAEYWFYHA